MSMRGIRVGVGQQTRPTYKAGAPSNYVAGLGRGAVGFTTRSDIGPARTPLPEPGAAGPPTASTSGAAKDPDFGPAPVGYVAGRGRGMGDLAKANNEGSGRPGGGGGEGTGGTDLSESNYDEFSGYQERLFGDTPYDNDDEEADRIYEAIDEHVDTRRKRRREAAQLEAMKKAREDRPKISDQFADLKGHLAGVSQEEWEAIPDVGDYSLKYKQSKRREIFTPMPDHVIEGARNESAVVGTMDPALGGATPGTSTTNIASLGHARGTVLGLKLDKMSDSVTGQTAVNPKGYLTDLNSLKINSDAEVGDIEKARLLLKSVTSTNPKHGPGWIAAARVEEYAGKIVQARKTIKAGCEACPDNEDVWLEAARLQTPENAKTVLANAVRNLPTSVKIWLRAAELETTTTSKKVVLRRALEFVPNSVKLWKTAIEMEGVEDALIMLGRAVECVPHSVDMWLALARLETYENAQKVLNRAREAIPTEPAIWITASKLEEAQGHSHKVDLIIEKAIASMRQFQVVIDREHWIKEAEEAEKAGAPLTCGAIIRATIHIGVEEEDRKRTWIDDAEHSLNRGAVETARAIYAHALGHFKTKKGVWMRACALEKKHGTPESLEQMLKKAVTHCPRAEMLWLMAAKEMWLKNDVDGARTILQEAFVSNPDSEQVLGLGVLQPFGAVGVESFCDGLQQQRLQERVA